MMTIWCLVPRSSATTFITVDSIRFALRCLYVGMLFGTISAGCWLASAAQGPWQRFCFQLMIVLLGAVITWSSLIGNHFLNELIKCTGMILGQTILFALFAVPRFNDTREASGRCRRQFSIANLVIATTVFAILLGFSRFTQPPIDLSDYWMLLVSVWILLPIISTFASLAILSLQASDLWQRLLLSLILCLAAATGLAICEAVIAKRAIQDPWVFAVGTYYLMIFLGHFAAITTIAAAGRSGASSPAENRDAC